MFRHSTKLILAGLTTAAVMATGGCSKKPDQKEGSAQVAVQALSLAGDVKAMDVAVSGPGIATPMDMPLFKQADGNWKALVNHIPVGTNNRSFAAKAYDSVAKTHQIYSGTVANVTINKNEIADVVIVMQEDVAPGGFGNHAPIVDSLSVSSTSAIYGEKVAYTLTAHDPDTGETATLDFVNTPSCGTFATPTITTDAQQRRVWSSLWTAPSTGTSCQLNMVITDAHGAKAMAAVTIAISAGVDVGGARVSTLVESYPVLTGITTNPAIITGTGAPITLSVLYSMSDNETASFAWTHPDCDGSFDNANIQSPVFTLATIPSSIPPICTFGVVVSGPYRTPTGGSPTRLSTIGSLTVNVGETTVAGNPGGGVAIDMTSQSLESVDPSQAVTLYVKASEHSSGATLTAYLWSAPHGILGTQTDASDLGNSTMVWTAPATMDPDETVNVVVTDSLGATATYTFIFHQATNPCVGPNTDNHICSDGNPCTEGDHCMNQVCVPGTPKSCAAIDDCHLDGVCDPLNNGACSTPMKNNGTGCNDGNDCTLADKCSAGHCVPTGGDVVCTALNECHLVGVCNPQGGQCSNPVKDDNTLCDVNNTCTTGKVCQAGQCTGGTNRDCRAQDVCHLDGTCDPVLGCVNPPASNATLCEKDHDACTVGDHCQDGACIAGPLMSCQPIDLCHSAGTCVAGSCPVGAWSVTCPPTTTPPTPSTGNAVACSVSDGQCHGCATPVGVKKFAVPATVGMGLDSSGAQYVAATLLGTANFGSADVSTVGGADVVVAKLVTDPNDPNDPHWTTRLGDVSDQLASGLGVTKSGRVAVFGTYQGSITAGNSISNSGDAIDFIAGLDSNGAGLWAKSVDTKTGGLVAVAGNPNRDEFVVCGYTMPCTHDPNTVPDDGCKGPMTDLSMAGYVNSDKLEDAIIAKLNSITGAVIWAHQYGGTGSQLCKAVTMDSDGNVFAAGVYNGNFGAGGLDTFGPTVQAIWVAKLDTTTGAILTAKDFGGNGLQSVNGIALDSSSNVVIAGNMMATLAFGSTTLTGGGSTDGYVAKLTSALLPTWAMRWGDSAAQEARAVAVNSADDIVVVGAFKGVATIGSSKLTNSGSGTTDAYFAKLRGSDGMPQCAGNYGNLANNQSGDSVAISTVDGKISMAGLAAGSFSFGTIPYASIGGGYVMQFTIP